MGVTAAYDEIADWYEEEFLAAQSGGDPLGIKGSLRDLLGPGSGLCLEVGCGTGAQAEQVRELGWTPIGVDISAGMLRHANGRLDSNWTMESWTDPSRSCWPSALTERSRAHSSIVHSSRNCRPPDGSRQRR